MLSKLSSRFEDPNPCLFFNQNPTQIKNIAQIQPRSPPSLQGGVSQGDVLCGLKRPEPNSGAVLSWIPNLSSKLPPRPLPHTTIMLPLRRHNSGLWRRLLHQNVQSRSRTLKLSVHRRNGRTPLFVGRRGEILRAQIRNGRTQVSFSEPR